MPLSVVLADGPHVELLYPHHRELRAWPSFELVDDAEVEPAAVPEDSAVAAQIRRALGGHVETVAAGPHGRAAALWTQARFPPWYRVVIWPGTPLAVTPPPVRISGEPRWSLTGELAVGAFDGIRRGIVGMDSRDGTTRWWSRPASSSYRLLALGPGGQDAVAVRCDRDGSAWLGRAVPGGADHRLQMLRPADEACVDVVMWAHDGITLEGLLALPPDTGPHPELVFLHGGPVGGLACGEHPDLSPWVSSGFAVFMPDFRASGIAGEHEMRETFRRRSLPADDPETGDVLAGVDMLVARGVAEPGALILFGHSYGGYLAGRIVAHDHRFRAAVCCEAVADLRILDVASQQMQAEWLGRHQPHRWAAASPAEHAEQVRTPMLLIYASDGNLAGQGQAWRAALTRAGVEHKFIIIDGADHLFSSSQAQRRLHQEVTGWSGRAEHG